jgi:virginiamycin B lyase
VALHKIRYGIVKVKKGVVSMSAAAGVITEFPLPTPTSPTATSLPSDITSGPDGNLWFTEQDGNQIGRITPQGVITEFPLPIPNSSPHGITSGPDGNLWFTEAAEKIGRITPQ